MVREVEVVVVVDLEDEDKQEVMVQERRGSASEAANLVAHVPIPQEG